MPPARPQSPQARPIPNREVSRWVIGGYAIVCCVFLFLFIRVTIVAILFKEGGLIRGWDGSHYYFWLRSIVFDHDVDFSNELSSYNQIPAKDRALLLTQPLTEMKLLPNKYSIGWALLTLPAMGLGQVAAYLLNSLGFDYQLDGYSIPYQLAIALLHLLYASASVLLLVKFIQLRGGTTRVALFAAFMAWAASPLLFYQSADITMAHGALFFSLIATFYISEKINASERAPLSHYVLLGLTSGLVILCRPQALVYLVYPALTILETVRKRSWLRVMVAALSFASVLLAQMLALKALYGHPLVYTYKGQGYADPGETFQFFAPQFWQVLFSPFHGALLWHPIFLIGSLLFMWGLLRHPNRLYVSLLIGVLLNIYINASWHCWWFGVSFGQRALEGFVIATALGISELRHIPWQLAKRTIAILCILLAIWNVNMTGGALRGYIPLDQPVTLSDMVQKTSNFWIQFYKN